MRRLLFLMLLVLPLQAQERHATAEDSVSSILSSLLTSTTIGGYGNALYQRALHEDAARATLERVVLFVGHRFSASVAFFSELEMEDAKVSGGEDGGEIAFEQAYLRFDFDADHYLAAGLFIPRLGILNENHLPGDFNGNERTQVETVVIPSTWRELGVGYYGDAGSLEYTAALLNGLNSGGFEHGSGIREGRFEGRNANANSLALNASLRYTQSAVTAQASGYYGGAAGVPGPQADALGLSGGPFGTPVALGEADLRYDDGTLTAKLLGAYVGVPDAFEINRAYAGSNTPKSMYGAYGELGYDILSHGSSRSRHRLVLFARYERLDLNASLPSNGVDDGRLRQDHVIGGLTYFPDPNVVVKGDLRYTATDGTTAGGLPRCETYLNLGIGFSF